MSQTPATSASIGLSSSDPSLNQVLQGTLTNPPSQPGIFKRALTMAAGVAGTAGSVLLPGLSSLGGLGAIGGLGGLSSGALSSLIDQGSTYGPSAEQYLLLAKQLNAQSEAFEAVTNVMKSKHSSAMAVIQNMSS